MRVNRRLAVTTLVIIVVVGSAALHAAAQSSPTKLAAKQTATTTVTPGHDTYVALAAEMETTLRQDVLGVWFPRSVDKQNGGFHSDFARDWQPIASRGKFSVFQGRMTWVAAQVAMRRPELKDQYLPITQHGVEYLSNTMWDKQYGGFYWGLDDRGQVSPVFSDNKHMYGMSFCLYGLAAAYQATHDPKTLALAQQAFRWMDEHAHDAKNGGYFEWLTREGKVIEPERMGDTVQGAGFPIGFKSMNTHIHLLESFTQLYEVWKDDTLRQRLEELLAITRDKISVEPGAMNLYFTNDWHAIPDHDSYGHDVETAYLMLEASEVLGHPHDPATERMAKMLVDHALAYGWDEINGGFYREGTTFGKPESTDKEWWVQMEGLNALLLMHEKYGDQNGAYFKAFQQQWDFVKDHQIDSQFGGLYAMVGRDGTPSRYGKAEMWKAAYHDGRALLNVSERLKRLAAE